MNQPALSQHIIDSLGLEDEHTHKMSADPNVRLTKDEQGEEWKILFTIVLPSASSTIIVGFQNQLKFGISGSNTKSTDAWSFPLPTSLVQSFILMMSLNLHFGWCNLHMKVSSPCLPNLNLISAAKTYSSTPSLSLGRNLLLGLPNVVSQTWQVRRKMIAIHEFDHLYQ